ncbi:hypothetical protein DEJ27_13205 [Curtobacterium sp. MCPF17_018]|uniref:GIY-YIG nuclease family protein n=1 Tax=Curtobacterium sp. MCPF17_018 TaxID=2175638 RepID=UPI000DA8521D|nr:hypothetical protein [Curtobacterium sp. MCPF17_018]PZE66838.1 hypothetical protein DEJ27_13205 [Curtobacterium sp. MCPF17_018]
MLTKIAAPLPELPDTRPPAGEPWDSMLRVQSRPVAQVERSDIPTDPGVYLWRWHGRLAYVGTASSLRTRIWGRHLGGGFSLGSSSLRRDVAEFLLGIPTTETIKGRWKLTVDERDVVRTWLQSCDIAWRIMPTPEDAAALEDELRRVWRPPLNRV